MYFLKNRLYFLLVAGVLFQTGCTPKKENLPVVPFDLIRFEQLFYNGSEASLEELQKTFPYFFPSETPLKVWVQKQNDSLQRALFNATKVVKTDDLNQDLQKLLGRFRSIFPDTSTPKKIFTLISDVDYENKVIDADSLLLISVDVFLGQEHPLYEGIPLYIRQNMSPKQMMPQVAEAISFKKIPVERERSFLAHMIYHGKMHWLKHQLLPDLETEVILGFNSQQLSWSEDNEKKIWNYFIANELLFSTQSDLLNRFIRPAPFSKFYLDIDYDSPGRIGQWLGMQIVMSYAKNTNKTVEEIINTPYMDLYRASKYKPRR